MACFFIDGMLSDTGARVGSAPCLLCLKIQEITPWLQGKLLEAERQVASLQIMPDPQLHQQLTQAQQEVSTELAS